MNWQNLSGKQIGPYTLEEALGSGGMAVVFRAKKKDGQTVALKILLPLPNLGPEIKERFEREARTAASLKHPAIVRVLEAGQSDGYAYIAMTLIEGQSLAQRLTQKTPFTQSAAADIVWQIADALYYAHARGVVHRDVKPSNILLDDKGRAFLTDFGVAQALDAPELTRTGYTVGTPAYMAPEQAAANAPVDGRADLYALGVVLYQMLTGRTPFQGSTPQVLHAHVYAAPPPPSSIARISETMEAIVLKALSKKPADRFQNGAAMAEALAQAGEEETRSRLRLPGKQNAVKKRGLVWLWLFAPILLGLFFVLWRQGMFALPASPDLPAAVIVTAPTNTPTSLATVAPRPAFTPTPSPTSSPSPTRAPSSTPTSPAAPTVLPALASTAPPTVPPNTPAPPVAPTAAACAIAGDALFASLLSDAPISTALGCPRAKAAKVAAAEQPFERGVLLWRQDLKLIYVLLPDQTWFYTGDAWREGDPDFDPALQAPPNLYQPTRGFGLVWRETLGARDALGWAVAEEEGYTALIQDFENGSLWSTTDSKVFIALLKDETYRIIELK